MKSEILKKDNIEDIKAWVGKSKFMIFWNGAYWTDTGLSPYKDDAKKMTSRFFNSELCKSMVKDENVRIEKVY